MMSDHFLDARNLGCPLPILKAKQALSKVPVGEILEILATDPGSPEDFVAFCTSTGNELVGQGVAECGAYRFLIKHLE